MQRVESSDGGTTPSRSRAADLCSMGPRAMTKPIPCIPSSPLGSPRGPKTGVHVFQAPGSVVQTVGTPCSDKKEILEHVNLSIPLQERHGADQWRMSLRDSWTRYVPVGNIFSGLFCPVLTAPGRMGYDDDGIKNYGCYSDNEQSGLSHEGEDLIRSYAYVLRHRAKW